jgi:hypothetical protein
MPKRFAEGFDPQAVEAMMIAYDKVCNALGLAKAHNVVTDGLAKIVVEQARTGERDPEKLYALTMVALKR